MSSRNVKRYHGKKANVVNNMFFEEYMQVVAKDKSKIKDKLPREYISRCDVQKIYHFSNLDFSEEEMTRNALICTHRGQTGLFFSIEAVRTVDAMRPSLVPDDWISEQTILRSFKKSDLPEGFPMEYQIYGRYGRKAGKPGRLTHFYSKEFLMDQFRLKVLDGSDCFILAKRVPFDVESQPVMCLRSTCPTTMVAECYFGEIAEQIIMQMRGTMPTRQEVPSSVSSTPTMENDSARPSEHVLCNWPGDSDNLQRTGGDHSASINLTLEHSTSHEMSEAGPELGDVLDISWDINSNKENRMDISEAMDLSRRPVFIPPYMADY